MKNQIIKGTFILTCAGFATRLMGFYYRIFLSKTIGAEGVGLYQMIFPIYGLCLALSVSGIHTAISGFVAEEKSRGRKDEMFSVFRCGIFIAVPTASLIASLLFLFSDLIGNSVFHDPRCAALLRIAVISIPLSAIHSCISGYYFGKKSALIPAWSQVLEQASRIASGIIISGLLCSQNKPVTASMAAISLVIGELASSLFCLFLMAIERHALRKFKLSSRKYFKPVILMSLPLTLNRVMLSFLGSLEAMLIPLMLKKYGLSHTSAISLYGILTGMAFPFIFFPSTITNSVASMLLPTIAEARAKNDMKSIGRTASKTLKYSVILGIYCTGIFVAFGKTMGARIFHEPLAGSYIVTLGWLCPFLYIATTFGSILNGLGKTHTTFIHNILSILLRLLFITSAMPYFGIAGYLWGILAAEILCAFLHFGAVKKYIDIEFNAFSWILIPSVSIFITLPACRYIYITIEGICRNTYAALLPSLALSLIIYPGIIFYAKIKQGRFI